MAVCGCGEQLAGAPPMLDNNPGLGILVSGTFDNTIVTAVAGTAWRPLQTDEFTTTNFTLNDGMYEARYLYDGFNVDVVMSFRFGPASTFVATAWKVALPWIPQDMTGVIQNHADLGPWSAFDSSTGLYYQGGVYRDSVGDLGFRFGDDLGASNGSLRQGVPFTFADDDEFHFITRFEAESNA